MKQVMHHYISWDTISALSCTLALQLKGKADFDTIICVGRGGMVPARLLSERLGIKDIQFCDCRSYVGICKQEEVHIKDTLQDVEGKQVLVVDDCLTSGKTLDAVYQLLADKKVQSIYMAVLYKNINVEDVFPMSYAALYDASKEWLVFPWENC